MNDMYKIKSILLTEQNVVNMNKTLQYLIFFIQRKLYKSTFYLLSFDLLLKRSARRTCGCQ